MASNQQITTNKRRLSGKKIILLGLAGVLGALVVIGGFRFVQQFNKPQPSLGAEFEYLGSQRFRCYFGGLMCDSDPYSDYYFSTNLTEDQMKVFFKGATYLNSSGGGGGRLYFP